MNRHFVPDAIRQQPWQVLLPLTALVALGSAVLYSAAGGHLQPYALTHALRFAFFLAVAIGISRFRRETFKFFA